MMKGNKWLNGIVQIVLILLASLLVTGATWQIGQSANAQQAFERGGEPDRRSDDDGDRSERPSFDGRGGDSHQAEWFSARGIAGFGEPIIKMIVVITAIVLGQRAWETYQARRSRKETT